MTQRCRLPLLLLCLTAAVATSFWGNTAVAAEDVVPEVQNLTNIPHNDTGSVVTKLVLEGNLITLNETDRRALASYPSLAELRLDSNRVTAVPADYFSVVPVLRVLSLSRNQISRLDPDAFSGLDVLTELDLSYNLLTSLPSQLLRGMNGLKELNLQGNPWNCSCPPLSSVAEITAANISIGAPGVTCASPEAKAGADLLEATAACYPSPTFTADPQTPTPVNPQPSRTTSAMLKTTLSSGQDQSGDRTTLFGNTWKFTVCVVALALTTSMLIVCAIKGPSWYKLFHNYRHRRLDQQEDDEDNNIASTVFSEIERYHNHQTFTFEHQNGRAEEEEDGYFEDPYIRREE